MLRRAAVMALALLLPGAAWGEAWSGTCQFGSDNLTPMNPTRFVIDHEIVACYRFTIADSTSTSDIFIIQSSAARICFDPDNTDAVADTSRVTVHECLAGGVGGGTGNVNTCHDLGGANGNATLDGTEGEACTQNNCIRVGPGAYFIRVVVACAKTASDYCQVSIRGEDPTY